MTQKQKYVIADFVVSTALDALKDDPDAFANFLERKGYPTSIVAGLSPSDVKEGICDILQEASWDLEVLEDS